jgi:hypothetical protein
MILQWFFSLNMQARVEFTYLATVFEQVCIFDLSKQE